MGVLPARAEQLVLIVEDHRLFAEAVDLALRVAGYDVRRIEVPADPGSPGALVAAIVKHQPVVVLLDLDLGRFGDGVQLIEPIARAGANVIVVTGSTDRARWGDAIQAGARKVLSKSQPLLRHPRDRAPDHRRAAGDGPRGARGAGLGVDQDAGGPPRGARAARAAHQPRERRARPPDERPAPSARSPGSSTVSEATVRTQVKSILAKLEVSSQLAAVGMAHEIGWRAPVA